MLVYQSVSPQVWKWKFGSKISFVEKNGVTFHWTMPIASTYGIFTNNLPNPKNQPNVGNIPYVAGMG